MSGMADPAARSDPHEPTSSASTPPTRADVQRTSGRCPECGYALVGLPLEGACPECGTRYTDESARRLQPWPSALNICVRLGWPVGGLFLAGLCMGLGDDMAGLMGFLLTWAMLGALAINSWFQVRWMLKRSLPDRTRTKGPVAIWRAVGTTVCVLFILGFCVAPTVLAAGCLIMLSSNKNWH
jgi:hypothetical protein